MQGAKTTSLNYFPGPSQLVPQLVLLPLRRPLADHPKPLFVIRMVLMVGARYQPTIRMVLMVGARCQPTRNGLPSRVYSNIGMVRPGPAASMTPRPEKRTTSAKSPPLAHLPVVLRRSSEATTIPRERFDDRTY
jgi:hypothetical protein